MSIHLSFEEQKLLADTVRRAGTGMTRREQLTETCVAIGFVAAVASIWAISPPGEVAVLPVILCTVVLALAALVPFATPFGFTVPTQLAFVPLLFAAPLALVPVATLLALGVARLPEVLRGETPVARLVGTAGNAWFSIGPAAFFAIAGVEPRLAAPALLIAGLASQFTVDFAVSAIRGVVGRGAAFSAEFGESWVYAIDAALSCVGLVVAYATHDHPVAVLSLVPLLGLIAVFARERQHRLDSLLELNDAYRGTAMVLGDVVEASDGYTGEHSKAVVELALSVAERLGLSAEQRRDLEFAALLHDVGKIAIPNEIINKPGNLSPEEWALMETHTIEGQKMLDRVGGFMSRVGVIVRSHHERWDGDGYPDGLWGEGIPLESRIIACCDTWHAMRTARSYRTAFSREVALMELTEAGGSQLDPHVVATLVEVLQAGEGDGSPVLEDILAQKRARLDSGL